jgi:hypothetical protein
MSSDTKLQPSDTKADNSLQARYKPIGLRAVVAATRCKPEQKVEDKRRERDIPAVLQPLFD